MLLHAFKHILIASDSVINQRRQHLHILPAARHVFKHGIQLLWVQLSQLVQFRHHLLGADELTVLEEFQGDAHLRQIAVHLAHLLAIRHARQDRGETRTHRFAAHAAAG